MVVVDDDPLVLAVTRRLLMRAGYEVALYEETSRALSDVSQTLPFAVVADLHMPDMSGSDLLGMVAKLSPGTWRLLYTGEAQASELARALDNGLTDTVVSKSAGPQLLPDTLDRLRAGPPRVVR
ncbi:MAG: Hydrogenase transcriptional regulatory protein hupR1 [Pseudomonadota bacterium]